MSICQCPQCPQHPPVPGWAQSGLCAMGWEGVPSPAGWGSPKANPLPIPVPVPVPAVAGTGPKELQPWLIGLTAVVVFLFIVFVVLLINRLWQIRMRRWARAVGTHPAPASAGGGLPARGGPGCCGVGTGPSPGTAQPLSPLAGSMAASRRPRGLRGTMVWALWGWHWAPHHPGLSSPLGTCWRCHAWPGMAESDGDAPGERSPVVGGHASLTPSSRQAGARRLRQPGGREGQRRGERRRGAEQGHVPLKRRPSPAGPVPGLRDAPSGTSSSAPSAGRRSTPGFAERPRGGKCRGGSRLPPRRGGNPGVDSPPAGVDRRGRRLGTGAGPPRSLPARGRGVPPAVPR